MRKLLLAAAALLAGGMAVGNAQAAIVCKDGGSAGYYMCWDEATRYSVNFPRTHQNGKVKTEAEVLEDGKVAVAKIIGKTGRVDRVLLLDQRNRIVEEIPAWKVSFLQQDSAAAKKELEQFKARPRR